MGVDHTFHWSKKPRKRGAVTRLFLMLLDRKDHVVAEGRRIEILRRVRNVEKQGFVDIAYPELEIRNDRGHKGFLDVKKAMITLTEKGWKHILAGDGVFAKIMAEMHIALGRGLI